MTTAMKQQNVVRVLGMDMNPMIDLGRRAWWAYLGVFGMAQDEAAGLAKRMVERGGLTEKDGRKMVKDVMKWPRKGVRTVESEVQRQIEVVLDRLGVLTREDIEKLDLPSKADIQALSEKVALLAKKVEQMRKAEEPQAEKTEMLVGRVETLSRKVGDLKKTVDEEVQTPVVAMGDAKPKDKK